MRIAVFGDVHGCIDELLELYNKLSHESLDAVYHLGDLVDRGPDSGAVVEFCRKNGVAGIMGNHEDTLIKLSRSSNNEDKLRSMRSLRSHQDLQYLKNLPPIHVIDELKTALVHGGVYPKLPLWRQPSSVKRLQLWHPELPLGAGKWWGVEKDGTTEEENYKAGWVRWTETHDHEELILYGHSVYEEPHLMVNAFGGRSLGMDTGCVFGGKLSAVILPDMTFISVKAKRMYWDRVRRMRT